MAIRFTDQQAEQFVLSRGLLTAEALAPFRVEASVGDSGTLFDILVAAKIITPEMLHQLEHSAPPPTQSATALRSIVSKPISHPTPASSGPPRRATRMSFDGPVTQIQKPTESGTQPATPGVAPTSSGHSIPAVTEAVVVRDSFVATATAPALASNAATQWLVRARQSGASDLYLSAGRTATIRVHGTTRAFDSTLLSSGQIEALLQQLLTMDQLKRFSTCGDLETACAFEGKRYRISLFRHRNGCDAAIRIVPERIFTLKELGLPEQCERLAQFSTGLVLVAGARGSGKTATMMALVDMINQTRHCSIITLESPIEHPLPSRNSHVTQREVGSHTKDYAAAIRSAMLEDPDVIVIGELSSPEVTEAALSAVESGKLVFSTIQAPDCARAIDRMGETHGDATRIRNVAADLLCALLAQQLIVRKDGAGRIPACELLINSISVGNIIREAKTQNLVNVMQMGRQQGMLMMDDSLKALVDSETITGDTAWRFCKNKAVFKEFAPGQEPPPEAAKPPEPAKPAGKLTQTGPIPKPPLGGLPKPPNVLRK